MNGLTAWRAVDELGLTAGQTLVVVGAARLVGGFSLSSQPAAGTRHRGGLERDRETVLALARPASRRVRPGRPGCCRAGPGARRRRRAVRHDQVATGSTGLAAIRGGGLYVTVTDGPEPERGITVTKVYGGPDPAALRTLADMASSGKLHTPVARAFPAADARAAYEEFAAGSRRGRIVLTF